MSNSVEQMREALKAVIEYSNLVLKSGMFHREHLEQIVKKCENAVSLPLRNCDVGTIKDQTSRFDAFCESHMKHYKDMFGDGLDGWDCKKDCPVGRMIDSDHAVADRCQLAWAQQQYRENEDN